LFLMAGNGANFCIAPLIRKPLTGQIAGLIGAYGSVGSVAFMTILLLTNPLTFFLCMAATGAIAFLSCFLIEEPVAPLEKKRVIDEVPASVEMAVA
jgi:NNP family nitrate/nitrite transporter-like MFS transporter